MTIGIVAIGMQDDDARTNLDDRMNDRVNEIMEQTILREKNLVLPVPTYLFGDLRLFI